VVKGKLKFELFPVRRISHIRE